jgi:DNA-binding response OmpR family regulator
LLLVGKLEWIERLIGQSRIAGDPTPIVVLNVGAEYLANAQILDAGADDCLAYPFHAAELSARMSAVMRRQCNSLARNSEIAADSDTLRIRVRDVETRVTRRQFDIFICLAAHLGRWVHSDAIIAKASATHHDPATSLVRVQIHALRKALGPERSCIRSDGCKSYMLTVMTI